VSRWDVNLTIERCAVPGYKRTTITVEAADGEQAKLVAASELRSRRFKVRDVWLVGARETPEGNPRRLSLR
jgi:hypothetical protein